MTPTHHPENSLEMMMMKSEEIVEKTQVHEPEKTQQAAVFCSGVTDDCKHGESSWEHFAEDDCDRACYERASLLMQVPR